MGHNITTLQAYENYLLKGLRDLKIRPLLTWVPSRFSLVPTLRTFREFALFILKSKTYLNNMWQKSIQWSATLKTPLNYRVV